MLNYNENPDYIYQTIPLSKKSKFLNETIENICIRFLLEPNNDGYLILNIMGIIKLNNNDEIQKNTLIFNKIIDLIAYVKMDLENKNKNKNKNKIYNNIKYNNIGNEICDNIKSYLYQYNLNINSQVIKTTTKRVEYKLVQDLHIIITKLQNIYIYILNDRNENLRNKLKDWYVQYIFIPIADINYNKNNKILSDYLSYIQRTDTYFINHVNNNILNGF